MKIFLAGIASSQKIISEEQPKYILESFYYLKDWEIPIIKKCDSFLLDSGAFTFMNNKKDKKEINWYNYIDKYVNFINKYDIENFFELDIDVLVGYEKVKEYTKYIEEKTNKKCIPVWHRQRGLEVWKELTKNYDYIALGGFAIKEIKKSEYKYIPKLLDIARKNNCKVHGLGFTSMDNLQKLKFYSVDSTTWLAGSRFGIVHQFNGKKIKKYHSKEKRTVKDIDFHNYRQWLKFQKYAENGL